MATFDIQLRGCVRFPQYMQKPKPKKCPLFTIRKILKVLQHVSFDWTVNPARLIVKAFLPYSTCNADIPVILSHRLVFNRLIEMLSKNLPSTWQILIKQLRLKPFLHQLSLIWLHKSIYRNSAYTTQFFLTKRGFDSCWLCHRLHFPRPCKPYLIQQHWSQLSTGNFFQDIDCTQSLDSPGISTNDGKDLLGLTTKNLPTRHVATLAPLRFHNGLSTIQAITFLPFQNSVPRPTGLQKHITLDQKPVDYSKTILGFIMQNCQKPIKTRVPVFFIQRRERDHRVFVPDFTMILYHYFHLL